MGRTHAVGAAVIELRNASGVALAIAVFALVATATTAFADPALDRARTAFGTSDYMAAQTALADALAAGDNSKDELVDIYKLGATIAAGLGSGSAATEAFERMLALAPDTTLPMGTSPKITRPFAAAQAFFKTTQPLAIKVDTASSPPALTVHVVSDPLHMIASARVIARVDGHVERTLDRVASDGADIAFALPVGRRIEVRAIARDSHGNRLAEVGTADVPLVIIGPESAPVTAVAVVAPPRPLAVEHHRSVALAWWLWGAAAVVAAGGGGAAVVGVYNARAELQRDALAGRSEAVAQPVESRGSRDAVLANVAFAGAGALAVTSAILFATRHGGRGREDDRRAHLAPATAPGGPAVVLEGRF
jgi:hypothetical protein